MSEWCREAKDLIETLGSRLSVLTSDGNSKKYIKERTSIEIQRGNATSVLGTMPEKDGLQLFK